MISARKQKKLNLIIAFNIIIIDLLTNLIKISIIQPLTETLQSQAQSSSLLIKPTNHKLNLQLYAKSISQLIQLTYCYDIVDVLLVQMWGWGQHQYYQENYEFRDCQSYKGKGLGLGVGVGFMLLRVGFQLLSYLSLTVISYYFFSLSSLLLFPLPLFPISLLSSFLLYLFYSPLLLSLTPHPFLKQLSSIDSILSAFLLLTLSAYPSLPILTLLLLMQLTLYCDTYLSFVLWLLCLVFYYCYSYNTVLPPPCPWPRFRNFMLLFCSIKLSNCDRLPQFPISLSWYLSRQLLVLAITSPRGLSPQPLQLTQSPYPFTIFNLFSSATFFSIILTYATTLLASSLTPFLYRQTSSNLSNSYFMPESPPRIYLPAVLSICWISNMHYECRMCRGLLEVVFSRFKHWDRIKVKEFIGILGRLLMDNC